MPPVHWDTVVTGLISAAILWGVRATAKALRDYQTSSHTWRERMEKIDGNVWEPGAAGTEALWHEVVR